jgi:hypothetical protein
VGSSFQKENYFFSTAFVVSTVTVVESTTTLVESQEVESVQTFVESVVGVSVDCPPPQDANATIERIAITFFIIVFFVLFLFINIYKYCASVKRFKLFFKKKIFISK